MRRVFLLLLSTIVVLTTACSPKPTPFVWDIPEGFPAPNVPADNPMTMEKVALGEKLFNDVSLSVNQQQSCASCHMKAFAFAEPKKVSVGTTGDQLARNSMALVNIAYNGSFTWAHDSLGIVENQILIPLFNEAPIEMGVSGHEEEILARLDAYSSEFKAVFGSSEPNFDFIIKALASYVRSLTSFNSDFDRYAYYNDDDALNASELRGMELFFSEKLECFHCHGGFNFTQSSKHAFQKLDLVSFHNTGLYNEDEKGSYANGDQGLADITMNDAHRGKFRAPTLRNIELTAPYMHDGSVATLSEVIEIYAAGGRGKGVNNPLKSPFVRGFDITEQEKTDLINFLESLTDESFVKD
ncbi:di-heme enzyme [Glaciecola sp. MH2013]|uniref:MbnH family di-heme enzyme n=1 Tax=Glaciecola sp. MH2013 TaxID=2785524 RepID=UPI00189E4F66|nr:MbnH family di-heme enzyme [Glaciecola sp. MH2013]MBF7072187.1 di-heme enzyme [Glaciecola sp. MH2013]